MLINLLQPEYFVPIHGELRHLAQHGRLAQQVGVAEENIAVVENGYQLSFGDELTIGERTSGGYVFVDGARVGEIGPAMMRERESLAESGFVVAIVHYDRSAGKPMGLPRIISRGFLAASEAEDMISRSEDVVFSAASVEPGTPLSDVEDRIRSYLYRFMRRETHRRPMVIPVVIPASA